MRYLKKPVVIEAVQFNGQNAKEIMDWAHKCMLPEMNAIIRISPFNHSIVVNTLEGLMEATQGDWIIKGVKGEFYPCKDEIFKATYDEVIDAKTDIKPCPFCGKTDKLVETKPTEFWNQRVRCYDCPCDGPEADFGMHTAKWNTAYCWKRIEQLEADYSSEVQAKELAIEKVVALEKQLDIEKLNIKGGSKMMQEINCTNQNDSDGNPTGGAVSAIGIKINWQDGPLGNPPDMNKINGAFVEGVIQSAIQRLEFFQESKFKCRENALAITKLEEALHWLNWRTLKRKKSGVEGTHV